jgi:hypothetical protein
MMFQPLDDSMPRPLPYSVEQVVTVLYEDISLRDRVIIANLSENELDPSLYSAMAKTIREEFRLYNGNTELLSSCCSLIGRKYENHEDPVMIIIKELWEKAQKTHKLQLVHTKRKSSVN